MSKSLVIVESPAKAKSINRFLGSAYSVQSCRGHVRDLPTTKLGIDLENDFKPHYSVLPEQRSIIKSLRNSAGKAEKIFLAPDPDREGEAIAWHLAQLLGVPDDKIFRVSFNEITRHAVLEAFEKPGRIDMNRVNAQQARRILDRLVGYQISPILWKKLLRGLSAGRVQSVAARLIVEREREIAAFVPKEFWKIFAEFETPRGDKFKAELTKVQGEEAELASKESVQAILPKIGACQYRVISVVTVQRRDMAPPPFVTSTLQQLAWSRLRFSAKKTMLIAQQLYEGLPVGTEGPVGLITYMRTDSVRVASVALTECRKLIAEDFGSGYLPETPNFYRSRRGAQEAHEAVRPASVNRRPDDLAQYLSKDQLKLYRLIWERFVASQMKVATIETTTAEVQGGDFGFRARGDNLIFEGHRRLTGVEGLKLDPPLPQLLEGERVTLLGLSEDQRFTKPPPRYTEASLIRALERKGIGRPSTYAPIVTTIQERGYVENRLRFLYATELGEVVTDKLVEYFPKVMDVDFTSHMEEQLDKIEDGQQEWIDVLREFYSSFKDSVERADRDMPKFMEQTDQLCEKCGSKMVVRLGKRGKFMACSAYPKCANRKSMRGPASAPPPTDQKCEKCGNPMVVRTGRRGSFLGCSAFPRCRNTKPLEGEKAPEAPSDEKCEKCGSAMVVRRGRRGPFLSCSAYPECRNTKPLPSPA